MEHSEVMKYGNEENVKEKQPVFWAVDREYPHVITKHKQEFESQEMFFSEELEDCFKLRREISPEYRKVWDNWQEYDNQYRLTDAQMKSARTLKVSIR